MKRNTISWTCRAISLACVAILLSGGVAHAATIIGPGDITTIGNDNASPMIVVDLNAPQLLLADTYTASDFSYQFSHGYYNPPDPNTSGSVTPLLLTSPSANNYTVIAMGDAVQFTAITAFAAHPFGGSDTFTLASGTTVYAGFYWKLEGTFNGGNDCPIGMANSGSSFLRYGGANAPVIDSLISGGTGATLGRTYDFSITVAPAAIPEPSTWALVGLALVPLFFRRSRKSC